jgi:ribose transport system substrate-binding protein
MSKKLLVSCIVMLFIMSIAGSAFADGKKIYYILKTTESEFFAIVIDGANAAAKKLGVNLIHESPQSESDVAKQIAIVETAIADKPDAIVLAPTVEDALVPAIEKAKAANIPLIIIDSGARTDQYTAFVASDNVAIGKVSADKMAEALKARFKEPKGKIAGITFMAGGGSLEKRKQGFMDQIKTYPGIEVVTFEDAQGKQGNTLAIVQNLLTAYPDLKGIYANNQYTGDETVRALDIAKRKDIAVVVVDAGPLETEGLKTGITDFMIVQKPWVMGYMGVEYAVKALNGEKIDKFIDTGVVAISPEMLKSGQAEEFLSPIAFHKKNP